MSDDIHVTKTSTRDHFSACGFVPPAWLADETCWLPEQVAPFLRYLVETMPTPTRRQRLVRTIRRRTYRPRAWVARAVCPEYDGS